MFTLGGDGDDVEEAGRSLARAAIGMLDVAVHEGAHPRFGVLDVVPFVPIGSADLLPVMRARDAFAAWAGRTLDLPCFLYGPLAENGARSLPEVRRGAFSRFGPDTGPAAPHPTAGATAVGARPLLVAYNLWIAGADVAVARAVAAAIRGPAVRALGFELTHGVQVSCNLVDPFDVGPADVYDRVAALLRQGNPPAPVIERAELVGLVPAAVLERIPLGRWTELDLAEDRTIEGRLAQGSTRAR